MLQLKGGQALSQDDDPALLGNLLALLRQDPGFEALGRALLEPEAGARAGQFALVWPAVHQRLDSVAHHHLALLYTRWGWNALGQQERPQRVWAWWQKALEAYGASLGNEHFLTQLCHDAQLPDKAPDLLSNVLDWLIEPHAQALVTALEDALSLKPALVAAHWSVLKHAAESLEKGGLTDVLALKQVELGCAMWQRRVIDKALAMVDEMARPVESIGAKREELIRPFEMLRLVTEITGPNEDISVWALEKCVEWSWPLYKSKEEIRLKDMLDASRPFAKHVESLLGRGTGAFGRNNASADYILFSADFVPFEEQAAHFRRALEICPGHRNSRLMLSYHKLNLARRAMDEADRREPPGAIISIDRKAALAEVGRAEVLLDEAEALFPPNTRLSDHRERLAKLKGRLTS